ncbi:MAG: hypothetical protein CMB99_07000 [Flavobacteriaceae bacterium]|nr:hypothetical protein [Flavobacteriaceae bacterium]|tara:strand:+ start:29742 stop:30227 length:486 start_codon:yes stop_codon:yes gene_type:complete
MNILDKIVTDFNQIPKESLVRLLKISDEVNLKKGAFLTKCKDIPNDFYIIKKGVVRSYYLNESGKEFTRSFFRSSQAVGALKSLITSKPSELYYECLTDCEVYRVNYKEFMKLTKEDIHLSNLYSRVLEYVYQSFSSKIYDLSVLSSTERYKKLRRNIPSI